ncbi:MAG: hypothetical protein JKY88_02970 [Pseudomonadales bacterium]|nr:hypothetical protein [Pseudomonadales bacterium]
MFAFKTNFKVPLSIILLIILVLFSVVLVYLYANSKLDTKWAPFVGGAAVSSIAALFQYLISFIDYRNNEKLKDSGVIKFLSSRGDKDYYQSLIKNSTTELKLLFHTSKRFWEDFCSDGKGDDLLIEALNTKSNLNVKLLILSKQLLPQEEHSGYDIAQKIIKQMHDKFGDRFQVMYYNHAPTHNIFLSDNDAVIGPYFEHVKSKNSHSIHFKSNAGFVTEYKEYFDKEWLLANDSD